MSNAWVAGVVMVVVISLAGCAQTPESTLETQASSGEWEQFHAEYPDVPKPDTAVVRTVGLDEWAPVIADCLNEAGFPDVRADPDGGLSFETPTTQASQFGLAKYICIAQYPIDSKFTAPPTEDMVGLLYDYLTKVQKPCLEAEGYEIPDPPSRAQFIETFEQGQQWAPYMVLPEESLFDGTLDELQTKCPQGPPEGSEYYPY